VPNVKSSLAKANKEKKAEFYTLLPDIERELWHYKDYFKNATILCNCDDPYESNFFKYFAMNFNYFGLKKLIATCYSGSPIVGEEISLFDDDTCNKHGFKVELSEVKDINGDGVIDISDVEEILKSDNSPVQLLEGNGDFASEECIELLKEADIVITNPPFYLFQDYVQLLTKYDKKFIIIGDQNAISYQGVFPLLRDNKMWLGYGFKGNVGFFRSPYEDTAKSSQHKDGLIRKAGVTWYTNLDIDKRHEDIDLYLPYDPKVNFKYDNYDAIHVSKTAEIPCDYDGLMAVPITFMYKYNPEQFEIVGITQSWDTHATKIYPQQIQVDKNGKKKKVKKLNDGPAIKVDTIPTDRVYYTVGNEMFVKGFSRILIKKKIKE